MTPKRKETPQPDETISRIEWLQIPPEATEKGPVARTESHRSVKARSCERCGWLNSLEDDVCFRCDHRQSQGDVSSREIHGMGVSLPPLEIVADDGLLTRFRSRALDEPPVFHRLRLQAERLLLSRGLGELQSWPTWNFELYEHQRRAVRKALSNMRGRAILADEVGLGKTIEAGVAMRELMARGLVRSVLILTPAALLEQWREELATKFGLPFEIATNPEDFQAPRVIASLSLARGARVRDSVLGREWDLLVVDEAHKLRRRSTLTYRLVNAVRKKYVLLLTATPIQNDLTELYSLANVLKPGLLGTIRSFKKYYTGDASGRTAKNPRRLRSILSEIMVRNRRSTVGIDFPARRAAIVHLNLGPEERLVYDRVTQYVREEFRGEVDTHYGALSLVTLQRELCSSTAAVRATLERMSVRSNYPPVTRARLKSFVDLVDEVPQDAKIDALFAILDGHPGKFLVYTDFLPTQSYIAESLRKKGIRSVCYHGSLSGEERAQAIAQFETPEVRVMISTGAGAEGLNLQFCHQLINYDLPWNPMRVEQRIGRVHRLGQENDVLIFNLAVEGTVEERVMELLAHKIRLFEIIVGELDQILGRFEGASSLEQLIAEIYLGCRNEREVKRKFTRLGKEVQAAREEFLKVKETTGQLLDELHEGEPEVS